MTPPETVQRSSGPVRVRPLRTAVPRLALGGAGPIGAFYAGSQAAGTIGGILAATATSLGLFLWERRRGRPGILARLSLAVILLQVSAGLLGDSARLYFLPKAIVDLVEGVAFFGSCLTRRPLVGVVAAEFVAIPRAVRDELAVRQVFVHLTLVWAGYFTLRGLVSLWVLGTASTPVFLSVRALIDAPVVIPLLALSVRHGMRRLGGRGDDANPKA